MVALCLECPSPCLLPGKRVLSFQGLAFTQPPLWQGGHSLPCFPLISSVLLLCREPPAPVDVSLGYEDPKAGMASGVSLHPQGLPL